MNKRGFWSLCLFLALFTATLFAELIANDKPLVIRFEDRFYFLFILTGSITVLTSFDFLGFGLPADWPSLGRLLAQGRANSIHAPWLGLTTFLTLATMLTLLIFVGEAVRDAFDPRKDPASGPAQRHF